MSREETEALIRENFLEGLAEGFAGVPMEFPEGIRPLGEFQATRCDLSPGGVSPDLDDEVIDAEIMD